MHWHWWELPAHGMRSKTIGMRDSQSHCSAPKTTERIDRKICTLIYLHLHITEKQNGYLIVMSWENVFQTIRLDNKYSKQVYMIILTKSVWNLVHTWNERENKECYDIPAWQLPNRSSSTFGEGFQSFSPLWYCWFHMACHKTLREIQSQAGQTPHCRQSGACWSVCCLTAAVVNQEVSCDWLATYIRSKLKMPIQCQLPTYISSHVQLDIFTNQQKSVVL